MKKGPGKKTLRRIRNVTVVLVVLLAGLWAFGLLYARPALESKIRTAFRKATADRYLLSFDELSLSYSTGGISIKNLVVKPNPDSLPSLRENGLLELTCAEASMGEIKFWRTFFGGHFAAGELLLDTPRLTLWNKNGVTSKNRADQNEKQVSQLHLDKIRIVNAQTTIRDKETDKFLFATQELNLFVDEFGITGDLIPVYRHFTLESFDNSLNLFNGKEFKLHKLFLTGGPEYTGMSASGFDITEIDSSLRKALKIPDEITFSLDGISLESESLADLVEQIVRGNTQNIRVAKLLLMHPQVTITTRGKKGEKQQETTEKMKGVALKLALPSIDRAGILDGRFIWREPNEPAPVLDISHINAMATGVRPRLSEKIPLMFSTGEIMLGETRFNYPKSDYGFSCKSLQYRSVTDSLKISGFRLMPHKNVDSFYMDKKWRVDRFEFTCDTIHFEDLRLVDFVFKNRFNPKLTVFKSPNLKAYTDKRLQHDPNFVKPFPVQRIRSIDGEYDIDRLVFQNGKISYSEKVAGSPGPGTINMEQANFDIRNIKSNPQPTDTARLYYNCSFGAGSYGEISMDIPLYGKDEIQYARGMIKHLPFKQLNGITENTVFMGFASGELDSCWFSFKAVNGKSEGNSVFYYNNLKVKLYKPVEVPAYKTMVLFNKTFLSLAANFLINKQNPTEEGYSMPGKLAFERDRLKGPLNFWIKTIMTGLMNTVIDDISELKDLQEEIKSLKSSSKTGILSKLKTNPNKKARKAKEAQNGLMNVGETK